MSSAPSRRVLFIGTGGILHDPVHAAELRDRLMPPTALPGLTTVVLDLSGMTATPAALRELIVPLGRRVKNREYGETRLVVATPDAALAEFVELLAEAHDLPLFLARSSDAGDVADARPAGMLTATDRETLVGVRDAGGGATTAQLAARLDIGPTAAANRLTNLSKKGYLHRYGRPRRAGDVFIDPRAPAELEAGAPQLGPLRVEGEVARTIEALLEGRRR
jgi:hypothetical protein